ncbi:MAG: cobalamin-binding protein [Clostridia bacterium]|nr:cobalamin-binding protein [Clostridia bacterium]
MEKLYEMFSAYLDDENKEKAVSLIIEAFEKAQSIETFVDIYTKILERSLNELKCNLKDKKICIWKEHVRSSIVRTILECAYPYIVKLRQKLFNGERHGTAVIVCPDGEYHEIGARMASDFFMLAGFDSIYVGSSTPKEEFIYAINEIRPKILALSVTNYYNIISAKRTIAAVCAIAEVRPLIVVGGNAFVNNPDIKEIGADRLANTYGDVEKLIQEVK